VWLYLRVMVMLVALATSAEMGDDGDYLTPHSRTFRKELETAVRNEE
jgi:hypothetical protein